MTETDLMHEIMLAASKMGYKIFRTNVGKVKTAYGGWFSSGLPIGHPDLYGFRKDGRIFYIEVKLPEGKVTKEQQHFINVAKSSGALAGVARSVEEAMAIINDGREAESNGACKSKF